MKLDLNKMINKDKGFTLLEVLVVAGIFAFTVVIMIRSFSRNEVYLDQATNILLGDIRSTQTKAISSTQYTGSIRCGYGIERVTSTTYRIYTGPTPSTANSNCDGNNRNYSSSGGVPFRDTSIVVKTLAGAGTLEFKNNFSDIFYEPTEPKVYINNVYNLGNSAQRISIAPVGVSCSSTNCKSICAYPSGRVEVVSGSTCP